jgi:hypothetical protein
MSESTMPDYVAVLSAVREALAVPYPATVAETESYAQLVVSRAMAARVALDAILDAVIPGGHDDEARVFLVAAYVTNLRERVAETPVTYRTWLELKERLHVDDGDGEPR